MPAVPASRGSVAAVAAVLLGVLFTASTVVAHVPAAEAASSFSQVTAPDGRVYKLYVPSGYDPARPAPLVLMLHGCTQDPDQFATGTRMNEVAEAHGFLVAYPKQPTSVHRNACWRWFDSAQQARGGSEPTSLVGVVRDVGRRYSVDGQRVFAAGLSAGGAMTAVLGATYPDVFAAVNVGAGLEYGAAATEPQGSTALSQGGPDPTRQGGAAYAAMGPRARVVPTLIFHGTSDYVVYPKNADQLVTQWTQTNDLAADAGVDDADVTSTPTRRESGQVTGGRAFTHEVYADRSTGAPVVERYLVTGMGHAWSGGSSSGSYTDPKGPNESAIAWDFFAAHPLGGGKTPTPTPTPSPSPTPSPTPTPTVTTATFRSIAAEDGFVGALTADGLSTATTKVGDKGMYNRDTYRSVLSFDTSGLPDGATISSAADLSTAGVAAVSTTGRTQLRLSATTGADFPADVLTLADGGTSTGVPTLTVSYLP